MLFLLLACAGSPDPDGTEPTTDTATSDSGDSDSGISDSGTSDSAAPEDTAPYLDDDAINEPGLSPDEQLRAVEKALSLLAGADPLMPFDLYVAAMDSADDACPAFQDEATWFDSCTADSGVTYDGYAQHVRYIDLEDSGNLYHQYDAIIADAVFTVGDSADSAEVVLRTDNSYYADFTDSGGARYQQTLLDGEFGWTDPTADTGWLGLAPRLSLDQQAANLDELFFVYINGAITGLDDAMTGGVQAVVAEYLYFVSPGLDADCTDEPGGALSVLVDDDWYLVVFHGPDVETMAGSGACDGCGDVWFEGTLQGTTCPDFTDFTDWEVRPW